MTTPEPSVLPGRLQQRSLRLTWRWMVIVLLLALVATVVIVGHGSAVLWAELSLADLWLVLQLVVLATLLVIAIAGIYSLVSQFAFWEGWLEGLPQPAEFFAEAGRQAQLAAEPGPGMAHPRGTHRRFLVYLDGIHQVERDHPPRITDFLNALEQALPGDTCLMRGLDSYTVMPGALVEEAGSTWFWRRVFALQEHHRHWLVQLVCAVLVQGNNVIKVGISSDRRYGPILNYELALKISLRLTEMGYQPGCELVLLGYSGGGEMALGVADYLRRLCEAPVRIITCCGVFSGNQVVERVERIHTLVGSRDPVAAFGQIAYPGRSPLLPLSNWNRARRQGLVERVLIPGMTHNGSTGPFAEAFRPQVIAAVLRALGCSTAAPTGMGWNWAGKPAASASPP